MTLQHHQFYYSVCMIVDVSLCDCRCKQCQRKRENMGKSNILHETRYTSGSRLMV